MFTRRNTRLVLATAAAVSLTGGLLALSTGGASATPAKHADDFNGDGYRDYATTDWGSFTVTYGAATGPGTKTRTFTQNSPGVPGKSGDAGGYVDGFGEDLAAADLNRDGYPELAVGVCGEKVGSTKDAGGLHILRGSRRGLTGNGSQWFSRATAGVPGSPEQYEMFGSAIRLRDLDGDGDGDKDLLAGSVNRETSLFFRAGASGITADRVRELDLKPVFPQ
jgi:hypothetical protein